MDVQLSVLTYTTDAHLALKWYISLHQVVRAHVAVHVTQSACNSVDSYLCRKAAADEMLIVRFKHN